MARLHSAVESQVAARTGVLTHTITEAKSMIVQLQAEKPEKPVAQSKSKDSEPGKLTVQPPVSPKSSWQAAGARFRAPKTGEPGV